MIIQLEVGPMQNLSYIIFDEATKEGALIDPGFDAEKILKTIKDTGVKIKYILLTHTHIDHISDLIKMQNRLDAKTMLGEHEVDSQVYGSPIDESDILTIGEQEIQVIETPGHTQGGLSFLYNNQYLFTGDTLFCKGIVGRTDLHGGNKEDLKKSIAKLMKLPEEIFICPGHNYEGKKSMIKNEKEYHKSNLKSKFLEFLSKE
ncbi:MBL fold metallo-hydrolase [Candidatus Pacearchaeota archaeon]|nr:MBL fold metallo-hydrolase [Candidatus Pacearchaeota archaeon]